MHKSELVDPALSGVAETLLIQLYNMMESRTDSRVFRRMV